MTRKFSFLPLALGIILVISAILAFNQRVVTATGEDKVYDFENGTLMGWKEAWGGSLGSTTVSCSSDLATTGNTYAMRLDLVLTGGGWEKTDIAVWPGGTDWTNYDFSNYVSLDYDILVPTTYNSGTLNVKTALNGGDGWLELAGHYNNVIADQSKVTINGVEYAILHFSDLVNGATVAATRGQVVIELAGQGSDYKGPIYIDNVTLLSSGTPSSPTPTPVPPAVFVPDAFTPPVEGQEFVYDFEQSKMSWWKAWGDAFDTAGGKPPVEYSTDLQQPGNNGSLKVNLKYTGGSWEEANIGVWLKNQPDTKFDLSNYESIEYDLYLPNPGQWNGIFKLATCLNSNWVVVKDLVEYTVSALPTVNINGITYAKIPRSDELGDIVRNDSGQLVIRLASWAITYQGPLYIDDVRLATPKNFRIYPAGFAKNDTLTGTVKVAVKTVVPPGKIVNTITLTSGSGRVTPMIPGANGNYECNWDTTLERDGFQTVTISGNTIDGATDTKQIEVYLKNSATTVEFVKPQFEDTISGIYIVKANIINTRGIAIKDVELLVDGRKIPMFRLGGGYVTLLDTRKLDDGVYSLVLKARDAEGYMVQKYIDVMIDNDGLMNSFVGRKGKDFVINGKPFYFLGFNDYSLPFKYDNILSGNEKSAVYTNDGKLIEEIVPKGTNLDFKLQVDRTMLEARKLGMTVLRTWAFNSYTGDAHSFINTSDWSFNEAQFQRLDYVMDSARRHGIRVMLALDNYWTDYGGIKATTDKLGIHMLEFFTNQDAKQMYKNYATHLVNRTNTVNNLKYSEDPTLFAWDLMNEPRMGLYQDTSPDKSLWDRDGSKMSAWINEMSTYIKGLDNHHMVTAGAEAQGFTFQSDGVTYLQGDINEGYADDPLRILDQPNIDFFTIHPYPNSIWNNYTLAVTQSMIENYVKEGHRRGKPVVMQEWGINNYLLRDPANNNVEVPVDDPGYPALKQLWFREMLKAFRQAGGNGSNVWMLQVGSQEQGGFTMGLYYPAWKAEADRALVEILAFEADKAAKMSSKKCKGHENHQRQECR